MDINQLDCWYYYVASVVSDSVRPHRRLRLPWDFPGKNTGEGCYFLLQCLKVKSEREVAQSCPTLSWTAAYQAPPPWAFPGKSIGVGCHCLLRINLIGVWLIESDIWVCHMLVTWQSTLNLKYQASSIEGTNQYL